MPGCAERRSIRNRTSSSNASFSASRSGARKARRACIIDGMREQRQRVDAGYGQPLDLGAHDVRDEHKVIVGTPLLRARVEERAQGAVFDWIGVCGSAALDVDKESCAQSAVV